MASLRDYFDTDFKYVLSAHRDWRLKSQDGKVDIEVLQRLHLDFDSYTKYISYYISQTGNVLKVCIALIENPDWALLLADSVHVMSGDLGQAHMDSNANLKYSGRIFLCSESEMSTEEEEPLNHRVNELGIALLFREPKYAEGKATFEKPLAFICHDSRDGVCIIDQKGVYYGDG